MGFGRMGAGDFGRFGILDKAAVTPAPPNTLVAARGFFVLNGDTMTPLLGYVVAADVGAFVMTGQSATLTPTASKILLVDGVSRVLLVDGSSKIIKAA